METLNFEQACREVLGYDVPEKWHPEIEKNWAIVNIDDVDHLCLYKSSYHWRVKHADPVRCFRLDCDMHELRMLDRLCGYQTNFYEPMLA